MLWSYLWLTGSCIMTHDKGHEKIPAKHFMVFRNNFAWVKNE